MARAARETWEKRIESWRGSGLSAPKFAEKAGVNVHTLRWWNSRIPKAPEVGGSKPQASFIEVIATASDAFEVILPRGITLRVPQSFDGGALAELLSVVEGNR